MILFKTAADLQAYLDEQRKAGRKIAFAPTMGALHDGHISLITRANEADQLSVCSIFVNPAQFNEKQDFEQYPSSIGADMELLTEAGCDVLFLPTVAEIYPQGADNAASFDFGFLESVFEGASRPGHFSGVGKVMSILLDLVAPDLLYMGSKDYQQCLIVRDLIRQKGLTGKIKFVFCPTRREPDGLAMSSRNRRLTEPQRVLAALLYQCLVSIQAKCRDGAHFPTVQKECEDLLRAKGFETDYVSIAEADTLQELQDYDPGKTMIALIAARIGNIRLIDNMLLQDGE
jgi:pantoate--beta-alanine ligase